MTYTGTSSTVAAEIWGLLTDLNLPDVLVHSRAFSNTVDVVYLGVPDRKFRITVEEVTE
ncbi:hypothetical protein [Stenotrophomonas virus Jojan60]|jgi:hypothetical protein|nr:hypothetical protein [Stenotrophomonas virus Jojan60]